MDNELQRIVAEIYNRGNTAEIKKRKNDVIVLEVTRKIVYQSGGQNGVR